MDQLFQEMEELEREHSDIVVSAEPKENMFCWQAKIRGPSGSPYHNGIFKIKIDLSENYPYSKPTIKFKTPIYHPNIDNDGNICVDVLNNWHPKLKIHDILLTICALLAKPNPDSPLRRDIAELYKKNYTSFRNTAIEWTQRYAK